MDILTGNRRLMHLVPEKEEVEVLRSDVSYYKRTPQYTATQIKEYLEIQVNGKIRRLHLFREIVDVHLLGDRVVLVGRDWLELLDTNRLIKEKPFKNKIIDTKVFMGLLLVLYQNKLSIFDKTLKEIEKITLPIKYPDTLFVNEEEKVFGILSGTAKSAYLFDSAGQLVQEVKTKASPRCATIFRQMDKVYVAVAYKNQIKIVDMQNEFSKDLATDHLQNITQLVYSSDQSMLVSVSREGILCQSRLEDGEGTAFYVDAEGIKSLSLS
ncbi:hypothetical protein NEHOM01_1248 [Nematocida homosporus]|uniref:uncharacterized protein n=1 Tax=Nematocida homosporus TaxID=1912981 RepID=UPI00222030FF|nr:uncharacterized protein NEHOM01_1248 [Nematocida homosporus]KAI5186045.1 hypothetical protein NEHOM01_1248 [Nematocida homosporus]